MSANIAFTYSQSAIYAIAIQIMRNSKEVSMPKPIFKQTVLRDSSSLQEVDIHPIRRCRSAHWAVDSARVAAQDSSLFWPEFINAENTSLQW